MRNNRLMLVMWLMGLCVGFLTGSPVMGEEPFPLPAPQLCSSLVLNDSAVGRPYPVPPEVNRLQASASGIITDAASTATSRGSVTVAFGYIQMSAEASGQWGTGNVSATCADLITIFPEDTALLGTPGRFIAGLSIEGRGGAGKPAEWISPAAVAWATYGALVGANNQDAAVGGRWDAVAGDGALFQGHALGFLPVVVDFTFGDQFYISIGAGIEAEIDGSPGSGSAFAGLDLVRWMGFADVKDGEGHTIAGYRVSSAAGFDWSKPAIVPEPATGGLLVLGLATLVRRTQRRTTDHLTCIPL